MKDRHFQIQNVEAAIYIQKLWRGHIVRATIGVEIQAKIVAARRLTRFCRRKLQLAQFKKVIKEYKNHLSVLIQRYLRGYV